MSLSKHKNLALSSVKKFFPQVEEVEDANEPHVTEGIRTSAQNS